MALILIPSSEVGEVTTTSGTGSYAVSGKAITRCFPFAGFVSGGSQAYFTISDGVQLEWISGTYTGGSSISRDSVLGSTSAGAAINWPATGQRFIRLAIAAETLTSATPIGFVLSGAAGQVGQYQATGNSIDGVTLSGDATIAVGGALTVAADAITNAKLANMPAHTFKGNNTAGSANPVDLTATQLTAELNAMVGDSGSGGTKGLVPAPGAGDAAAGKFLKADGTFAVPSGSGLSSTLTSAHLYVGNASNVATDVAASGDLSLANTGAFTIAGGVVNNSKLATMASHTVKGNNTASTAAPLDLTRTQVAAEIAAVGFADTISVNFNAVAPPSALVNGFQAVGLDAGQVGYSSETFANTGEFIYRRANNTNASPAALASGDVIGSFQWRGYGTAYTTARVQINGTAAETWTGSAQGAFLDISTTPTGSTSRTLALRVQASGGISVGNTTDNGIGTITSDQGFYGPLKTTLTSAHLYVGNGSGQAADVAASGDLTLANTGAFTLNTINSNVGSFTRASITVNGKGLITAAASEATGATASATPANPTGTTSASLVMMGLAGSITPAYSGRVLLVMTGLVSNNTGGDGANLRMRYGTGSAPANGDASTGTAVGATLSYTLMTAAQRVAFSCCAVITGLSVSTAYWLDMSLAATTGGTANIWNVTISAIEF